MIRKVVKMIASDPLRVPSYFWSKLHTLWLSTKSNVNVEGKLRLNGKPLIDIQEGSFLFKNPDPSRFIYYDIFLNSQFNFFGITEFKNGLANTSDGYVDFHNSFLTVIARDGLIGIFK